MVDQLSLKWIEQKSTLLHTIDAARKNQCLCDVTLATEDGKLHKVHKLVLAVCSEYFNNIFKALTCEYPVVILKDISSQQLEHLLDFMYLGEVNVSKNEIQTFIATGKMLKIKGLTNDGNSTKLNICDADQSYHPARKRKKLKNCIKDEYTVNNKKIKSVNAVSAEHFVSATSERVSNITAKDCVSIKTEKDEFPVEPGDVSTEIVMDSQANRTEVFFKEDSDTKKLNEFCKKSLPLSLHIEEFYEARATNSLVPLTSEFKATTVVPFDELPPRERKQNYVCPVCYKEFTHKGTFRQHYFIHSGEKPFACPLCDYKTRQPHNLSSHVRSRHKFST